MHTHEHNAPDPFASVLGTRRGKLRRRPHSAEARRAMREQGHERSEAKGDVALMLAAQAQHMSCAECGHSGLVVEHYRHRGTRRILRALCVALTAGTLIGTHLAHLAGGEALALALAVVSWHIARDFGRGALTCCPECRTAHRL